MDLFEYQARDLFEKYDVPVLQGLIADTPEEAAAAAAKIGGTVVVKAQVKAGGRGKAGGVKLAHSPEEAATAAEAILQLTIKGHKVNRVMIAQGASIAKEYYFSVLLDRSNRTFLSLCSVEGGMEIEQLAVERPDALAKITVDAIEGIDLAKAKEIAKKSGGSVEISNDPIAAAKDASVVYTDVWMSMGDPESERNEKMQVLAPFAVTESLMSQTAKDSIFMHCLPAHRGEEVEASVIDGAKSVIWREAFHRRTTIQALLYHLTRGELKGYN